MNAQPLIAPESSACRTEIRVVSKEVNDFGDAKCACCGRPHRKMHRMSTGAVMGSRCAELVESVSSHFGGAQRAEFLKRAHPASPALRFAAVRS